MQRPSSRRVWQRPAARLIAGACVVIVGSLVAVRGWKRGVAQAIPASVVPETVRVTRRSFHSVVKAIGVIKPRVGAEVRVGSRISGVVDRLYVKVGDNVTAGQRLAELDSRDLVARRDQASADVRRWEAELQYAEADLRRNRELKARGAISAGDFDVVERTGAVAQQQLAVSRAALTSAAIQVDYAQITAPISGVVASVATQEGETVAASFSAPTFVTLIDLTRLEVWAYVDETDIGRIRVGQPARFTVDTYGEQEFEGRVTAIYPKAEIRDNVVDYVTVVRFEPPPGRTLRPDMTTTVRITIAQRDQVLSVPLRALRSEGGRSFVRLRHGEAVEQRWVATGARDETACEITDGLREGDEILADGSFQGENTP